MLKHLKLNQCTMFALNNFTRHPERSEAESNFFVPDPKLRCAPFAPHCVRSSTALRMTRTKKRRAKQGGIYEQLTHNVRTPIFYFHFLTLKGEPPTRVLPLSLLRKEIHPLLRFTNDKSISHSAECASGRRPENLPPFEKGGRKLFLIALCKMYK